MRLYFPPSPPLGPRGSSWVPLGSPGSPCVPLAGSPWVPQGALGSAYETQELPGPRFIRQLLFRYVPFILGAMRSVGRPREAAPPERLQFSYALLQFRWSSWPPQGPKSELSIGQEVVGACLCMGRRLGCMAEALGS